MNIDKLQDMKDDQLEELEWLEIQLEVERDWLKDNIDMGAKWPRYHTKELIYDCNEQIAIYEREIARTKDKIERLDLELLGLEKLKEIQGK